MKRREFLKHMRCVLAGACVARYGIPLLGIKSAPIEAEREMEISYDIWTADPNESGMTELLAHINRNKYWDAHLVGDEPNPRSFAQELMPVETKDGNAMYNPRTGEVMVVIYDDDSKTSGRLVATEAKGLTFEKDQRQTEAV